MRAPNARIGFVVAAIAGANAAPANNMTKPKAIRLTTPVAPVAKSYLDVSCDTRNAPVGLPTLT